jgi:hypothetical protein
MVVDDISLNGAKSVDYEYKGKTSFRLARIISEKPCFLLMAVTVITMRFVFVGMVFALSIHLLKYC